MGMGLRDGNRGAGTFTGRGKHVYKGGERGLHGGGKEGRGRGRGRGKRRERKKGMKKNSLVRRINMNESITNPKKRVTFANI